VSGVCLSQPSPMVIRLTFQIEWKPVKKRGMQEAWLGGYLLGRVQEHIHQDAWVCSCDQYRNGKDYYPGDDESIEDFYDSEREAMQAVEHIWLGKFMVMGAEIARESDAA
jgi:hypothetical protein